MSLTGIAPTCACEEVMHTAPNGLFYCSNCDVPQPQERELDRNGKPKGRVKTLADRRFHLAWERRKREIYG